MERNYEQLLSCEAEVSKKSSFLELEAREAALNLKEKEYKILSLERKLQEL